LDFGSITRLVWHFDEGKNAADTLAIAYPQQGQIFSHTYPAFYGAGQHQTHTIKLFVYSGKSCADFLAKEITLLPAPKLQFDQLPDICLNADPLQFTQAREISGLNSSEIHFTGAGVSAQGTFNPALAGQGQHIITYHFTSVSGCETSISQSINVLQPPKVNAEATILVLQGNSILLKPHYEGSGLTYQWSPATGLDNANSPTPLASPVVTTTYKVTVSNGACAQSANILVTVLHPPEIFNTFTPNGDGNNDLWSIPHLQDYPKAHVTIFNRYGAQLYYSSGYYQPWDGKFAGKDVPVGTYYYIIKPGNGQKNFSGFVTVIR
jgi:gliding motility-associated-like protein